MKNSFIYRDCEKMVMKEFAKNKEFERMMTEALKRKFPFFAWKSVGGVIEKCELKIRAFRKDYNELEFEVSKEMEANLEKVVSGDRNFNIYIPELSVSFTSELKSISEDKKIKIYLPNEFNFFERRKHERVQPSKSCFVCFEYKNQVVRVPIHDVSMGGIAIILPRADKIIIEKGTQFFLFILEFGSRKIKMNAECANSIGIDRHKFDNLPYGGFKIAFRYLNVSEDDRRFLAEYITHETILKQVQTKAQ